MDCCTVIPPRLWQKKISGAWNMNEENFLQWAVVTLSGTGAEMNPGAVITYEEKLWKRPIVVCRSRSCLRCNGSAGQISVWLEELGLNLIISKLWKQWNIGRKVAVLATKSVPTEMSLLPKIWSIDNALVVFSNSERWRKRCEKK